MAKDYLEVVVVSVETGTGCTLTRKECWVNALAFSPDGKFLACGLQEGLGFGDRSHHVAVWRMPSHERVSLEIKHDRGGLMDYITGVAFTPGGAHMVSTCVDGTVAIWRVGRFDRWQTLVWKDTYLTSVAATDSCIAVTARGLGFGVWG
jgi:WD40 repeat protein